MESHHVTLLPVILAAMLAPLLAEIPKSFRPPIVVLEILLGMIIGPPLLNLATPDAFILTLSDLGLTFLLFLVGMEISQRRIVNRLLWLAGSGWLLSLGAAMIFTTLFHAVGIIQAPPLLAAIALSTTALGVLMPILRDQDQLETPFGRCLLATATAGEFGPLVFIALLGIQGHSTFLHTLFIVTFVAAAFAAAYMALHVRSSPWIDRLAHTLQSSGQLPVRICLLLLVMLVALAAQFGLNVVIGAFAAGMVVGLANRGERGELLRQKLDAIGYGFLVPIFFVVVGMKFNLSTLWSSPVAPVQLTVLLVLFIVVRGLPLLLFRKELTADEQAPFVFYSATGLPLIVVVSEIAASSGLMSPDRAAVLVAAGMISVLLFPLLAQILRGKFVILR